MNSLLTWGIARKQYENRFIQVGISGITPYNDAMKQIRMIADRIGIDPWDIDQAYVWAFVMSHESTARSRHWFGSPCRFIRQIDILVHVILPEMLYEKHPVWACYLRSTSPRWGRAWRSWN